jgi:hypothetical protein
MAVTMRRETVPPPPGRVKPDRRYGAAACRKSVSRAEP